MAKQTNPLRTALRNEAKQLRSDARKLDTIAKHLRQKAQDIVNGLKAEDRAEAARANFFSKKAKIDPNIPLVPDLGKEDPVFPEKTS